MASTAVSELVFFIVTLLITASAVAVLSDQTIHIVYGMQSSSQRTTDMIQENFAIINNPDQIPYDNGYVFYIKNTGSVGFAFDNTSISVLVDGSAVTGKYVKFISLENSSILVPGQVGEIVVNETLSGYNSITISLGTGVSHTFNFEV
ncbi:flagella-related protein G [Thermoplasma volcanium GSS1]|uniref:Flagella-related protein G n=1 Tax=Thermoplasma volcanium (strain ATCC 51530 / DSM 4299 / JCM 9571 / NBRC 15438 / GSS1) TaxID=273116 RepID=Q97B48_THEVO|nr:flagellar protein G [Thermoplasma volcanium]BAB59753.1 flagella-related protein G [Thermoplasma volcanium GSS1]